MDYKYFGLSIVEYKQMKYRYWKPILNDLKKQLDSWLKFNTLDNIFYYARHNELTDKISYVEKKIKYYKNLDKESVNIAPIADLKKYPITSYLEDNGMKPVYQRGNSSKYLCPLHNENTPSFYVTVDKNLFHCFGCGKGGSIIDLIMQYEKIDLKKAVHKLRKMVI